MSTGSPYVTLISRMYRLKIVTVIYPSFSRGAPLADALSLRKEGNHKGCPCTTARQAAAPPSLNRQPGDGYGATVM